MSAFAQPQDCAKLQNQPHEGSVEHDIKLLLGQRKVKSKPYLLSVVQTDAVLI